MPFPPLTSCTWGCSLCCASSSDSSVLVEPPYAEPHVRWCGRGVSASLPLYPIACAHLDRDSGVGYHRHRKHGSRGSHERGATTHGLAFHRGLQCRDPRTAVCLLQGGA